uniref:Uncharacterized protein n=1 Tax=Anguilla anguilla TaxID=7936 RepID=A0A0E9WZP9_ANGAN
MFRCAGLNIIYSSCFYDSYAPGAASILYGAVKRTIQENPKGFQIRKYSLSLHIICPITAKLKSLGSVIQFIDFKSETEYEHCS